MEKLISNRSDLQSVRESYILPPGTRPGNKQLSFYKLANHRVPHNLLHNIMNVTKEFFELPCEDKANIYSEDAKKNRRLYTSIDYMREKMFDKMSEKLISNRSDLQFVPESYILPPGTRPGNTQVSVLEVIPVIDFQLLGTNRPQLIKQIIEASQEFGFFQLINHGVEDNLLHKVLDVANEFFEQPYEDKASMYSEDVEQSCRLYTSIDYNKEKVHFWRDNLRHPCHPLEQQIHFWPQKPPQYREVVGSYSVEARKLSILLLDLIGEGLGLESGFFRDELTEVQLMGINYYPPCPDPSLTLGLPKHSDVNLITLLLQGEEVHGLQVLKDGQWLAVEPVPNAFVVNIGHTLQIISNGKLGSAEHRVMTNEKVSRTTVGSFIHPSSNYLVEPAKALLDRDCSSSPLFRAFVYKDFVSTYVTNTHEGVPPLEPHKIQPRSI